MSTAKVILIAGVCLLLGLAAGWGLTGTDAKRTDIRWKYGNSELVIDLEKDLASDEVLLAKIFSTDYSAAGARDWLKGQAQVYDYKDPAIAEPLATVEYDEPVSRSLRDLRNRRVGPWSYQIQEVNVGIPGAEFQPRLGHANVCESGIFRNRTIEVFLPDQPERRIKLEATGRYSCPEGYKFPDLQLNALDAEELFGFRNFSKLEPAAAIVVGE